MSLTYCLMTDLYDEEIGVDDQKERKEVYENRISKDIAAAEPVLAEVVSSAGRHVALRNVSIPAKHGRDGPYK